MLSIFYHVHMSHFYIFFSEVITQIFYLLFFIFIFLILRGFFFCILDTSPLADTDFTNISLPFYGLFVPNWYLLKKMF